MFKPFQRVARSARLAALVALTGTIHPLPRCVDWALLIPYPLMVGLVLG